MTELDPWEMDEDDPEAPWNKDPAEGMPETITPGQIDIEFWKVGFQDERVLYEFTFTWDGGLPGTAAMKRSGPGISA